MNEKLKSESQRLSADTINESEKIIAAINTYTSSFNIQNSFSFSISKKQIEGLFEDYLKFASSIYNTVIRLSNLNATLSSLLIEADKAMEIELTLSLESRFNAYKLFEASLYEYTSTVESAFDNNKLSISVLLNSVQKFKNAVLNLILENEKSISIFP